MSPSYRYLAAQSDGHLVRGRIEAVTGTHAATVLRHRGLQAVNLTELGAAQVRRPVARRELAIVFRGLAALVEAGVPLERAVAASENLAGGALRRCLAEARAGLGDGKSLAQALEAGRGMVPGVVLAMLGAGEKSGRLGATLEQVAVHLEHEAELVSRLRHALAYPALLATAGTASVLVIGTVVVPKFASLLAEVGQELPPATRLLLRGSALVMQHWPLLLASTLAVGWTFGIWIRGPAGMLVWHRALLGVPGAGRIRHGLATVRVARGLGGGLAAGMPLLSALEATTELAADREISARLARARERVAGGEPLTSALVRESALTPAALQLIAIGEESGQLAAMSRRAGDLAAQEAERAFGTLVGVLEPALVVLLGGFVAFVAAALLQAIYGLRPVGV